MQIALSGKFANRILGFLKQGRWSPSTPDERQCVSDEISRKVREGWEQRQAIAAAHSICQKQFEGNEKTACPDDAACLLHATIEELRKAADAASVNPETGRGMAAELAVTLREAHRAIEEKVEGMSNGVEKQNIMRLLRRADDDLSRGEQALCQKIGAADDVARAVNRLRLARSDIQSALSCTRKLSA